MNTKKCHLIIDFILLIVLVVIDRFTKIIATAKLKNNDAFVIIKNVFELHYLENKGAAFSVFENKQFMFIAVSFIFVAIIMFVIYRLPVEKKYYLFEIVLVFLISGAIGNMIDRLMQRYVVDFFYFKLINFPIFNVADIYVSVGCVVFAFILLFVFKEDDLNFLSFKKNSDE